MMIEQGYKNTQYITFGDEERIYQLLGSPSKEQAGTYDFELRVDNEPNQIFVEFQLDDMQDVSPRNMFMYAVQEAQKQLMATEDDYVSRSPFPEEARKGIDHLSHHLNGAAVQLNDPMFGYDRIFDFDKLSSYADVSAYIAVFEDKDGNKLSGTSAEILSNEDNEIYLHSITDNILERSREVLLNNMPGEGYPDTDLRHFRTEKGEADTNQILVYLDDKQIGIMSFNIFIHTGYETLPLPDGTRTMSLDFGYDNVTWSTLEHYEQVAKDYLGIDDDFAASVASIQTPDDPLKK